MARSRPAVATLVPDEVMNGTLEAKIRYMRGNIIAHPNMQDVLKKLLRLTTPGCGTDITLLIGPTGAGKTETFKLAKRKILDRYAREIADDTSHIPVALLEAPASGRREFSWGSFYKELGKQLNEPALERKRDTKKDPSACLLESPRDQPKVSALKDSVVDSLSYRRTKVILIDEGRHLISASPGETLDAHMNAIKSLANPENRTLGLSGAYDLLRILDLNDQVNRRIGVLHMQRYLQGNEEDEKKYRKVIASMQVRIPIRGVPDLTECSPILMETCVGCVGTTSDTFARAVAAAHDADGCWKDRYLEEALLSERQVAEILAVVQKGEEEIAPAAYGSRPSGCLWNSK